MSVASPFPRSPLSPETGLGAFFQNAPVGMAQCSAHGALTATNASLRLMIEEMTGKSLEAAEGVCFADLLHVEDRAESQRLFHEMVNGERECFQIENRAALADGGAAWVKWTGWRVPGVDGKPESALVMAQDATGSRHSEQRLRQAERLEAVGRLAGGVAHDFNNLLTGVLLYCDLLLAGLEARDPLRRYAEEVRGAAVQATGIVQQLLSVARPGNAPSLPLSLNEVAEGMRTLLIRLIGENIELRFHLDPSLGVIKMDPAQAQQVLLNLALNARDALPNGGRITVETRNGKLRILDDGKVGKNRAPVLPCALLVVSDNGGGMDCETRQHLFEAFFTTKAAGQGTGLGLATVHDIVTGAGGLIHVASAPGQGTRVTVLLPLVPEQLLPRSAAPPSTTRSRTAQISITERHEGELQQQEKESKP
jgi:two-component system, cell cycle sensor histidine kinase and response regulator CckA